MSAIKVSAIAVETQIRKLSQRFRFLIATVMR